MLCTNRQPFFRENLQEKYSVFWIADMYIVYEYVYSLFRSPIHFKLNTKLSVPSLTC